MMRLKSADSLAKWAAIAIGFSVPVSVALDNILMPLVFLLWILGGNFWEKYESIRKNPVALSSLALLGSLAIGMLYGKTPFPDALGTFGKYIDLLFVPVFVTLFKDRHSREWALRAFMSAMLLTLFLSYLLRFGIAHQNPILRGFAENPFVFKLHITQNFFMSFATLVLTIWAVRETDAKKRSLFALLALAGLANVLFMVQGRIGYIVLALLLVYLFFIRFGKKGLIMGMAAALMLGSAAYYGSKEFRDRIDIAAFEFTHWKRGHASIDTNSIGQRMEFYTNTAEIIAKHPFFGVGTGGFEAAYAEEVAKKGMLSTHNPHDEYLLIMVQTGLPGILVMLALFCFEWREAANLSPDENLLARGLVIAMASGCLFNSFLLDHAEGLFFAFMSGVLFSGRRT